MGISSISSQYASGKPQHNTGGSDKIQQLEKQKEMLENQMRQLEERHASPEEMKNLKQKIENLDKQIQKLRQQENTDKKVNDTPARDEKRFDRYEKGVEPETPGVYQASERDKKEPVVVETIGNTDRVDREIEKLKEERSQLSQQIQQAEPDDPEVEKLKKQMTAVEAELKRKDNDIYRKQHMDTTQRVVKKPHTEE